MLAFLSSQYRYHGRNLLEEVNISIPLELRDDKASWFGIRKGGLMQVRPLNPIRRHSAKRQQLRISPMTGTWNNNRRQPISRWSIQLRRLLDRMEDDENAPLSTIRSARRMWDSSVSRPTAHLHCGFQTFAWFV
jgi:hypothetical protein